MKLYSWDIAPSKLNRMLLFCQCYKLCAFCLRNQNAEFPVCISLVHAFKGKKIKILVTDFEAK